LLLILDRREDPITPLLQQWTYQAMVHELVGVGLRYNVVDLGEEWLANNPDADDKDNSRQRNRIVLSQTDEFFAKNMFKDYGLLAQNTKKMLDDYKQKFAENKNLATVDDMTRFVENLPEFKKLANNALKHASVVGEITKAIEARNLLEISKLEQQIACSSDHATHVEKVKEKNQGPPDSLRR